MSFQVDGIITYTQQGKINCTIVDIENNQKYTIDESSITKTETISDEDREKLISGSQSGDVTSDKADSTGVDVKKGTVISSNIDTNIVSSGDENPQQDPVTEQINTEIKNKKIPNVTKLEFVLQKSPETSADAAAQKIAADETQVIDPAQEKGSGADETQVIDPAQETGAVQEK
jgi:hypothetical protein